MKGVLAVSNRIAFVSGKGGVGKSTIVSGIALALSAMKKRVLIVDCDACADAQKIFFNCREESLFNLGDLMSERCDLCSAVTKVRNTGISIITPPENYKDTEFTIFYEEVMNKLSDVYDYILFDASSGMDNSYNLAIKACEVAVIITTDEPFSLAFAEKIAYDLEKRKIPKRFVINKLEPKNKRRKGLDLDELSDRFSTGIIGAVVMAENHSLDKIDSMLKEERAFRCIIRIAKRLNGEYIKFGIDKRY